MKENNKNTRMAIKRKSKIKKFWGSYCWIIPTAQKRNRTTLGCRGNPVSPLKTLSSLSQTISHNIQSPQSIYIENKLSFFGSMHWALWWPTLLRALPTVVCLSRALHLSLSLLGWSRGKPWRWKKSTLVSEWMKRRQTNLPWKHGGPASHLERTNPNCKI